MYGSYLPRQRIATQCRCYQRTLGDANWKPHPRWSYKIKQITLKCQTFHDTRSKFFMLQDQTGLAKIYNFYSHLIKLIQ